MPNFGPVATFFAADFASAFSGFFVTHKALPTGENGL
jgi:hypothetical protein